MSACSFSDIPHSHSCYQNLGLEVLKPAWKYDIYCAFCSVWLCLHQKLYFGGENQYVVIRGTLLFVEEKLRESTIGYFGESSGSNVEYSWNAKSEF